MESADRERSDPQSPERGEGTIEIERRVDGTPAHGREDPDRFTLQSVQGEAENRR